MKKIGLKNKIVQGKKMLVRLIAGFHLSTWKAKLKKFQNTDLSLPWISEPSAVNNKLKRREGSGIQGNLS
jgi:hypothetical protein